MEHCNVNIRERERGCRRRRSWQRIVARLLGVAMIVGSLALYGCDDDGGGGGEEAAVPDDLENRSFTFTNGAVFHNGLAGESVTLMFGEFTGDATTGPVRLSSGAASAVGRVAVSSCNFTFTSSTFAQDDGPQAGDGVATDCNYDTDDNTLTIVVNGTSTTSGMASEVQPTLEGVVYVESNLFGENANSILAFRRDEDGALTPLPGSPFLTSGSGVAIDDVPTVGAFDSDQNIIVNPDRTRLFAVNSGSDTIAVFDILPDGGLVPVPGSPFNSGGINPVSVGLASDRLYVANKNDDPMRREVTDANFPNYTGFTVADDGSLTPIPGSTVELDSRRHPPTQTLISRDNRFVFGADFFSITYANAMDNEGVIQSFRINDDGSLTQNTPVVPPVAEYLGGDLIPVPDSPFPSRGFTPVSLGLAGDRLYVVNNNANPMLADRLNNLPNYRGFDVAMDGSLTPISGSRVTLELPTQNPTQALISPNNNFLFGADLFGNQTAFGPGLIQSFRIRANGRLVSAPNSPLLPPEDDFANAADLNGDGIPERFPLGLQVHPTMPILYVGFVTANRLGVYTYDEMTGELTFVRSVPNTSAGLCWIVVNQAGTRLYTSNTGDNTVSVYDLADPLTPVEIQRVALNGNGKPLQFALDDNDEFLYVISQRVFPDDAANGTSNKLSVLQVNADGTLTEVPSSPTILDVPLDPFTRPQGVATVGDVVYVESNDPTGNSIIAFRRDAAGALTELSNSPFPTGGAGIGSDPDALPILGPFDTDQNIITNPAGTRLFAVNGGSNDISVFNILASDRK